MKYFLQNWNALLAAILLSWSTTGHAENGTTQIYTQLENNEQAIANRLIESIKATSLKRHPTGVVKRFNQGKGLGCFDARFTVFDDLPEALQHGLFAMPGDYPAKIRFANASQADDRKKDFRGMSIKVEDIDGITLWGENGTQDFILNSYPALFAGTPQDFLAFVEAIEKEQRWRYFINPLHFDSLWIVLRGREKIASQFDIRYFSTTPYQYGSNAIVKYAITPCSSLTSEIPKGADANFLTSTMQQHLQNTNACFDFSVQFQSNPETMPIEDASVIWDESESPFIKVASIRIEHQHFTGKAAMEACEQITFNPWQALGEHKPLGGINRVRGVVYDVIAEFRTATNIKRHAIANSMSMSE